MPTYYVDNAGSDSNTGLLGAPWQTIGKVNGFTFAAGDALCFTGGQTFTGNLVLTGSDLRLICSSSSSRAVIDAGINTGIRLVNPYNVRIVGMKALGEADCEDSIGYGFRIENNQADAYSEYVYFVDCEATGFASGIGFDTTHATGAAKGFRYCGAVSCAITNCSYNGIGVAARINGVTDRNGVFNRDLYFANNELSYILGFTGVNSGYPFSLTNIGDSVLERNYCHHAAENSTTSGGGAFGFVAVECNGIIIQDNEVSFVQSPSGSDGGGVDFDAGCVNCIARRNYVHDCEGPALQAFQLSGHTAWSGNVYEFNIGERNGTASNHSGGFCAVSGSLGSYVVAHNTLMDTYAGGALIKCTDTQTGVFVNNTFIVGNLATFGTAEDCTFYGNTYYVRAGSSFSFTLEGVARASLVAMQGAGFETFGGTDYGYEGNPLLSDPGNGTAQWPTEGCPNYLAAYDLSDSSPSIDAGIDPALVSVTLSSAVDFRYQTLLSTVGVDGWTAGAVLTPAAYPTDLFMADTFWFNEGARQLQSGGSVNWGSDTIRARLVVAGVVPDINDTDLTTYVGIGTDATLSGKIVTNDTANDRTVYSASSPTIVAPGDGNDYDCVVVYKFITDDASSLPLYCLAVSGTTEDADAVLAIPSAGLAYSQQ